MKEMKWIPINEDDPDSFPPVKENWESGCLESGHILLSFDNVDYVCAGHYVKDENGAAFYGGEFERDEVPLIKKYDLIVNAWMPYPKPYRE